MSAGKQGILMRAFCFSTAIFASAVVSADEAPSPVVTPILQTTVTSSGQPLKLPGGKVELDAVYVTIPPGGATSLHRHPWSRFAYVEQGRIRVENRDTGQAADFEAGSVIVEAVNQWHVGRTLGPDPVKLVVFDLVPPGTTNVAPK
jgi:quercetin dioxygenase-like cupin family protein